MHSLCVARYQLTHGHGWSAARGLGTTVIRIDRLCDLLKPEIQLTIKKRNTSLVQQPLT